MSENKVFFDEEGLRRLVDYINLQIEMCKNSLATAEKAGIIRPGIGLSVANDGTLSITDEYTNDILSQTTSAANRASQSAIIAGNYAAQAIQAKNAIDNKIWYGTIEEYNALETVSQSTIYIILHE